MSTSQQPFPYNQLIVAIGELWDRLDPFFSYFEDDESLGSAVPERWQLPPSPQESSDRLAIVRQRLALSPCDRDILLLCAAMEILPELGWCCAKFHSRLSRGEGLEHVSPGMLASIFGQTGVESLDPTRPLRAWQLVQIGQGRFSHSLVQIDRSLLQYLMGHTYEDTLFIASVRAITPECIHPVPASYQAVVDQVHDYWRSNHHGVKPIQICGQDVATQQALLGAICPELSLSLMSARSIPLVNSERHTYSRRWQRQAFINRSVLGIDCHELNLDERDQLDAIAQFIVATTTPVVLLSHTRLKLPNSVFTVEVPSLTTEEQKTLWRFHLSLASSKGLGRDYQGGKTTAQIKYDLGELVAQFNLSPSAIATAVRRAHPDTTLPQQTQDPIQVLWESCRLQSRAQLEGLAQRVEPRVTWDDLVLSEETTDSLQQVISQVRQRATVYDTWQMGGRGRRGLGITAMFHGGPGTGKTTAAELIARELNLDLYRIDLSAIVSKYIGETEKNLAKIFTAAEAAGAILQFDEADAIIGKRSEVSDARDRYANMEVSYLLQRMEAYPGLAVLTTNLPNALDAAFLRRIRFSIEFKFPSYKERLQIWQRVYRNKSVPIEDLDPKRLAAIDLTGAMIRNVALGAAFLAADEDSGVTMEHMVRSLKAEYRKQNRSLTTKDINILLSGRSETIDRVPTAY
ncbi:MAG: ATP-binding protein [Cyanobacteria bacterium P01_F01_bin.86]